MKSHTQLLNIGALSTGALFGILTSSLLALSGAQAIQPRVIPPPVAPAVEIDPGSAEADTTTADKEDKPAGKADEVVIEKIEPVSEGDRAARKRVAWLGVSTEEASETLSSQLGLESGAGLVVTYVGSQSPAAKAELKKNDVLVELDGQLLVHPSQLRKLVRSHKEGDQVKLEYFRGGKKQTVTVTLAKTAAEFGSLEDQSGWQDQMRELKIQLNALPIKEAIREQMKNLHVELGKLKIDEKKVQDEVRRGMEEARKAIQDAFRHTTDGGDPAKQALEALARSGVSVDDDATITVRSTAKSVKSNVKADDAGTIVLVCNPKAHLTAHDKNGKLLFDGEIETPEQRDKVPRDLWERVQPMVDKLESEADKKVEDE
jgi:hypothetical protein